MGTKGRRSKLKKIKGQNSYGFKKSELKKVRAQEGHKTKGHQSKRSWVKKSKV